MKAETADPEVEVGALVSNSNPDKHVSRTRHDLQNAVGHILGFAEILLEEAREQGQESLRSDLEFIQRTADQMLCQIRERSEPFGINSDSRDLQSVQEKVCRQASQIIDATDRLTCECRTLTDDTFRKDLLRISGAARKIIETANISVGSFSETRAGEGVPAEIIAKSLGERSCVGLENTAIGLDQADGCVLVVDDLEENRELLSRRLTRLGYSVQVMENGQRALDFIAVEAVDLILLDIVMPGLNGIEVLRRLKSNPATQHIPVVMLSSEDQTDTVVLCIKLGADDFLPKPFNATLLLARIESSLSKKRLHDREAAFLRRLQAEQENSQRLLLNILPKAIAERLKQGEIVIADGFADVTVLFSDFVGFTKLSSTISPKELVSRLNQIFSAFDHLCDRYGLEKIKMIGDAYMVAGGIPTARADHAEAVADLALAMQREAARLSAENSQAFQMRIGINTGPVVAGVIGTKKFAYDLWGDTVNVASRMESHAPPGGIRVTAATYRRLRDQYNFEAGGVLAVKGKGEVETYLLLGKSPAR